MKAVISQEEKVCSERASVLSLLLQDYESRRDAMEKFLKADQTRRDSHLQVLENLQLKVHQIREQNEELTIGQFV